MEQKHKSNRMNKGGRPKKGAADKLKYRLTVKMATSDYYTLKGKVRSAGISAGEFLRPLHEGRAGEGTAHAGAYRLCPPTLRYGEQPEPTCAQGEHRGLRHGEDGMPHTRGTD